MQPENTAIFRSGTSGIVLTERNKKEFPQEFQSKSHLTYYASLFNSLEVNSTFYKVPRAVTIERWAASVPDDFQFTFKLWRGITHAKDLLFNPEDIAAFMQTIGHTGHKKGCLLIQFPASISDQHASQLEKLLEKTTNANPHHQWKMAVEFRNTSLYTKKFYSLLDKHRAGIVLHDMPVTGTDILNAHAPFVYLRFHGPKGDYKGGYSDEFLYSQAKQIKKWLQQGKDVYTYFNNTAEGDAPKNVVTLNGFVDKLAG